jgi:hypothetical protein
MPPPWECLTIFQCIIDLASLMEVTPSLGPLHPFGSYCEELLLSALHLSMGMFATTHVSLPLVEFPLAMMMPPNQHLWMELWVLKASFSLSSLGIEEK